MLNIQAQIEQRPYICPLSVVNLSFKRWKSEFRQDGGNYRNVRKNELI